MRHIFVFGSNLSGRHGKGAALHALKYHKAIYGQGAGLQGNSYAIPTKDSQLRTLPIIEIQKHVNRFINFAAICELKNRDYVFNVTPIGCGLAGYEPEQIAPLFKQAIGIKHVNLPKCFLEVLV